MNPSSFEKFLIPSLPQGYKDLINALFLMLENDILDEIDPNKLHQDVVFAAAKLVELNGLYVFTAKEVLEIQERLSAK